MNRQQRNKYLKYRQVRKVLGKAVAENLTNKPVARELKHTGKRYASMGRKIIYVRPSPSKRKLRIHHHSMVKIGLSKAVNYYISKTVSDESKPIDILRVEGNIWSDIMVKFSYSWFSRVFLRFHHKANNKSTFVVRDWEEDVEHTENIITYKVSGFTFTGECMQDVKEDKYAVVVKFDGRKFVSYAKGREEAFALGEHRLATAIRQSLFKRRK